MKVKTAPTMMSPMAIGPKMLMMNFEQQIRASQQQHIRRQHQQQQQQPHQQQHRWR
ncbi:GM25888 [Drosophila sechellia]|uniref:GM25888 n=1 Tax=Drosophila sechellia TaxID=7238 RepID=B4IEE6_DROSE|nr:GM25888 [Drosophila sechellia]